MEDLSKVVVQEDFSYGPHDLQTLTVYNPVGSSHNEDGYFLIYIHGGAWRDPLITPSSILPTLTTLLTSPPPSTSSPTPTSTPTPTTPPQPSFPTTIRALASLSYRLSPHPSFPQPPPPSTPSTSYRNATHPDHLLDILSALAFLQRKYAFGSRYILVGHSCGATLALQALMRNVLLSGDELALAGIEAAEAFVEPEIIIGVAGIYDLRLLAEKNSHPAYREFLTGAFGSDEKTWDAASPALFTPETIGTRLLVLATSRDDELVDGSQIEGMSGAAGKWAEKLGKGGLRVETWKDVVSGGHDEIWSDGKGLASIIEKTLGIYFGGK